MKISWITAVLIVCSLVNAVASAQTCRSRGGQLRFSLRGSSTPRVYLHSHDSRESGGQLALPPASTGGASGTLAATTGGFGPRLPLRPGPATSTSPPATTDPFATDPFSSSDPFSATRPATSTSPPTTTDPFATAPFSSSDPFSATRPATSTSPPATTDPFATDPFSSTQPPTSPNSGATTGLPGLATPALPGNVSTSPSPFPGFGGTPGVPSQGPPATTFPMNFGGATSTPVPPTQANATSALIGTWQSNDRILAVSAGNRFRVYWNNQGRLQADDGSYTVHGRQIHFRADKGSLWKWNVSELSPNRLTMSHAEAGTRAFRRVQPSPGDLAGTYKAAYKTDRGTTGTGDVVLFEDGTYVIREFTSAGRLDHTELGTWATTGDRFSMTVSHQGQLQTLPAQLAKSSAGFAIKYRNLLGVEYVYACRKSS